MKIPSRSNIMQLPLYELRAPAVLPSLHEGKFTRRLPGYMSRSNGVQIAYGDNLNFSTTTVDRRKTMTRARAFLSFSSSRRRYRRRLIEQRRLAGTPHLAFIK